MSERTCLTYPFRKTAVMISLLWPMTYELYGPGLQYQASIPSYGVGLKSNQKVAGCSHNLCASLASVGTSHLAGWHCGLQDPLLGETIYIPSPAPLQWPWKAPLSTMKVSQVERSSQFSSSLISLFCNQSMLYLQQQGFTMRLRWATQSNDSSLCCFTEPCSLPD